MREILQEYVKAIEDRTVVAPSQTISGTCCFLPSTNWKLCTVQRHVGEMRGPQPKLESSHCSRRVHPMFSSRTLLFLHACMLRCILPKSGCFFELQGPASRVAAFLLFCFSDSRIVWCWLGWRPVQGKGMCGDDHLKRFAGVAVES